MEVAISSAKSNDLRLLLSFLSGIAINLCTGTVYIVGVYGPVLKEKLHFSEKATTYAETICVAGLYTGFLGGLFYDKCGGKIAGLLGSLLIFLLYAVLYLVTSIETQEKWVPEIIIFFIFFFVGQAQHLLFVVVIGTNLGNFPERHRGKVVGLLTCVVGAGGAVWAIVYKHALLPNYFLIFGLTLSFLGFFGAFVMKKIPSEDTSRFAHNPLEFSTRKNELSTETNVTGLELFKNLNFWLLFVVMALEDGAATMFINKSGEMILSLTRDGRNVSQNIAIVFSISNAFGRLTWGVVSDLVSAYVSRAWILSITMVGMTLSMAFVAIFPNKLFLAGILVGFNFGGLFSLGPSLVTELFGFKYFGTNWGILLVGPAISSFSFGVLFVELYEKAAQNEENKNYCTGVNCFRSAFVISCVILLIGCVCSILLAWRTSSSHVKRHLEKESLRLEHENHHQEDGIALYHKLMDNSSQYVPPFDSDEDDSD